MTLDTKRVRRLKAPRDIEVETDEEGVPRRVRLAGGWQDVELGRSPWRIDQRWWRAGDDGPVSRLYYRLVPEASPPLTVYKDLLRSTWHRQEY